MEMNGGKKAAGGLLDGFATMLAATMMIKYPNVTSVAKRFSAPCYFITEYHALATSDDAGFTRILAAADTQRRETEHRSNCQAYPPQYGDTYSSLQGHTGREPAVRSVAEPERAALRFDDTQSDRKAKAAAAGLAAP